MYVFTKPDPRLLDPPRSPHNWDMPFFFGNIDLAPAADVPGGRELSARASGALLSFVRCGSPGHAELPDWPAYSLERRTTMLLGDECRAVEDPDGADRQLFTEVELSV
jgi:para-nitrobenzyl esterase